MDRIQKAISELQDIQDSFSSNRTDSEKRFKSMLNLFVQSLKIAFPESNISFSHNDLFGKINSIISESIKYYGIEFSCEDDENAFYQASRSAIIAEINKITKPFFQA